MPNLCKGLASYTKDELSRIFLDEEKYFFNIEYSQEGLQYFINNINVDSSYRKNLHSNEIEEIKISDERVNIKNYINSEFKEFLHSSNKRIIPSLENYLNDSSRKICFIKTSERYIQNQ